MEHSAVNEKGLLKSHFHRISFLKLYFNILDLTYTNINSFTLQDKYTHLF